MKKVLKALPLVLVFVIVFAVIAVAWRNQEAKMNSIRISSKDEGVGLQIRLYGDDSQPLSQSITIDSTAMELKPCVYNNGTFTNQKGTNVTDNAEYVRAIEIFIQPESSCNLRMSKVQSGDLPVKVIANDIEVTDNTGIAKLNTNGRILTLYFYIDGEEYTEPGTATIDLTLVGA